MSFLNFGFHIIAFEDQAVTNPQIRSADISRSMNGIPISAERTDRVDGLAAGESRMIAATARELSHDATTVYSIVRPLADDISTVRLAYVSGTEPAFATVRNLALIASASVVVSRVNPATARLTFSAATTSSVQVGDVLKIEKSTDWMVSPFALINQNEFKVVSKGVNTIDVLDNGVMSDETVNLGANPSVLVRCFKADIVRVGDTIEINGTGQNPQNCGKFEVRALSPDYVELVNPYAVELQFTNTDNVNVYDGLIGFVCVRANSVVSLKVNGGAPFKIQRIGSNEAVFIGSLMAFKLELINEEQNPVSATVHFSRFI